MAGVVWQGRSTYVLSVDQPGACFTLKSLTVGTSALGSDWSDEQSRWSLVAPESNIVR